MCYLRPLITSGVKARSRLSSHDQPRAEKQRACTSTGIVYLCDTRSDAMGEDGTVPRRHRAERIERRNVIPQLSKKKPSSEGEGGDRGIVVAW